MTSGAMPPQVLERVLEISRRLAETQEIEPLLQVTMGEAMQLVKARRGYLVLLGSEDALEFRVRVDTTRQTLNTDEDEVSTSVIRRVIERGQPVLIRDAQLDPDFRLAESVANLRLRSVMCVPLISRGRTIGAIFVENRTAAGIFTEDDLAPLILFANQVAVLIENAVLHDELNTRFAARTRDLHAALRQLEHSWLEGVDANRLHTEFLGKIAHDVRAPLSVVLTGLALFEEGMLGQMDAEAQQVVSTSMRALEHALDLIRDLFDLFKIDLGRMELVPVPLNLNEFLEEIGAVGAALPWPEEVQFRQDFTPDLPVVEADPMRLRQIILNLLANALKFTASGTVRFYACPCDDCRCVLIGVSDTGPGIPQDRLHELFVRFAQFSDDPLARRQGSGLGLAIVSELVEMHGGEIWVESIEGEGADFKFTLPVAGT